LLVWLFVGVAGIGLGLIGLIGIQDPQLRILAPAIIWVGAAAALVGYFVQSSRNGVFPTKLEVTEAGITLSFLGRRPQTFIPWNSPALDLGVGDCYGPSRLARLGENERFYLRRAGIEITAIPSQAFDLILATAKQRGLTITPSEQDADDPFDRERVWTFQATRPSSEGTVSPMAEG
jgi:hypothetical protein